jgi:hypothetical protein
MKKIFITVLLLILSAEIFSQQPIPQQTTVSKDYLEKSKNQKKTGRILLIGGTTILIASFVIPRGDLVYDGICVGPYCSDEYKNDNLKTALFLSGVALDLASIPFFIASKRNKKRAMKVSTSLKMEKTQVIQYTAFVKRSYPVLSVKIRL